MNLALFDLDNTLLACDSDYEWGQFLVDRGVLDRAEYEAQNAAFYEQYKAGTLDIHEFLGFALRPLAEHTPGGPRALARRIHGGAHPAGDGRRRRGRWCAATSTRATCAPWSPPPTASSPGRSRANSASRTWSRPSPSGRRAASPAASPASPASARARSRASTPGSPARGARLQDFAAEQLLQRLAQRPAAARARHAPGGGRSGRRRSPPRRARRGWPVISLR